VVKVVYALLAILMAGSLFLVTGAPTSARSRHHSSGEAHQSLEEQARGSKQSWRKRRKTKTWLLNLTRTRINVANTMITTGRGSRKANSQKK